MHDNAIKISKAITSVAPFVTIVYSDPDPSFTLDTDCKLIQRPNHLFWEDKFKACIDECGNSSILIIHADCVCNDWAQLVKRCFEVNTVYRNMGVWAPKIDGTAYPLKFSKICDIHNKNLNMVALTDGIVFSLSQDIIHRIRQINLTQNPYGWGIDLLFCAAGHAMGAMVVIDGSVEVHHPETRGYAPKEARKGLAQFQKQFSWQEQIQCELLLSFVRLNRMILQNSANKN